MKTLLIATVVAAILFNPTAKTSAFEPWPAESWTEAVTFTHLDSDFKNNMSGATWNPESQLYWVCRNGRPSAVWALAEDGNGNLKIATDSSGIPAKFDLGRGDLEGICLVQYDSFLVYLMFEGDDIIKAYDMSVYGKPVLKNQWDISAYVPTNRGAGSEGITFVPDNWLDREGFVDGSGNPYTSRNGMGGLMFVAHQNGGKLYVFDLNPVDGSLDYVGAYTTSQTESCGLEFDRVSGLLYIWHNTGANYLEVTRLSSFSESGERRLISMAEYVGPKEGNLEGIAITPSGGTERRCLVVDDDNHDGAAVMYFQQFYGGDFDF